MRSWKDLKRRNDARCTTLLGRSALLDTSDIDWSRAGEHELDPALQPPPPAIETAADRWTNRFTRPIGHVVTSGHMAWGATNELLTLNGYRLLTDRVNHPQLRTILKRIAAQESRHYSFYVLQLEWRLAASHLVRTTVRNLLARTWTPVGVGADFKTVDDYQVVMRYLSDGDDGERVRRRMNATMDRLPGLAGLELYRAA